MQLVLGEENLTFDEPVSTPIVDLTTSKLHWNSVISTPGAKYLVFDDNVFYLNNPMSKHKYHNISISLIPRDAIDKYNLMDKRINGFLYVRA